VVTVFGDVRGVPIRCRQCRMLQVREFVSKRFGCFPASAARDFAPVSVKNFRRNILLCRMRECLYGVALASVVSSSLGISSFCSGIIVLDRCC